MRMLPGRFDLDSFFDGFMNATPTDNMKCDIYEKDGSYHIEADMPGIDKKDLSVEYDNGYLTVKAVKEDKEETNDKNFIRKERFYGSMERRFYVGDIKEDEISANFENGVLKIEIPKETTEKSNKVIEIK